MKSSDRGAADKSIFRKMSRKREKKGEAAEAYDPFFGANVITLPGFRAASDLLYAPPGQTRQTPVSVRFIPYYGFANRGESDMTVWFRPAASK